MLRKTTLIPRATTKRQEITMRSARAMPAERGAKKEEQYAYEPLRELLLLAEYAKIEGYHTNNTARSRQRMSDGGHHDSSPKETKKKHHVQKNNERGIFHVVGSSIINSWSLRQCVCGFGFLTPVTSQQPSRQHSHGRAFAPAPFRVPGSTGQTNTMRGRSGHWAGYILWRERKGCIPDICRRVVGLYKVQSFFLHKCF